MARVSVVISTVTQSFPAGTVGGNFKYSIEGDAVFEQQSTETSVAFDNVPPGNYIASAQLLDSVGGTLGDRISAPFTVAAPSVDLQVPSTITVVLS